MSTVNDSMSKQAPQPTPFNNSVERVYESLMEGAETYRDMHKPYLKYSIVDGELRMQNNIWGILSRSKPNADGVWVVRGWLSGFNYSGWSKLDETDFALLVAETQDASVNATVSGDSLEDSEEACRNVVSAIDSFMFAAANRRDNAIIYKKIPGLVIESAGGSHPYQADGTWNDFGFYFRYRHNWASLVVGKNEYREGDTSGLDFLQNPHWASGVEHPSPDDGNLTVAEFTNLFLELWEKLEPTPFKYEFEPVETAGTNNQSAWVAGWDAHVAWLKTKEYPFDDTEYQSTPVTEDFRIYPWPAPKFVLLD